MLSDNPKPCSLVAADACAGKIAKSQVSLDVVRNSNIFWKRKPILVRKFDVRFERKCEILFPVQVLGERSP